MSVQLLVGFILAMNLTSTTSANLVTSSALLIPTRRDRRGIRRGNMLVFVSLLVLCVALRAIS